MYNAPQRIEEGREAMRRHPARDLTAFEVHRIREEAGDVYEFGENMFLLGVAIGRRIAAAEQEAKQ